MESRLNVQWEKNVALEENPKVGLHNTTEAAKRILKRIIDEATD